MIGSVRYVSAAPSQAVAIAMQDGTEWTTDAGLPPDTEIRRMLRDWVTAGGVIAPYASPPAPIVPITRRQLRLWLVRNGVTTLQVETVIAAIQPEQAREEAWIEWQDASSYERTNPLVVQVGQALGLTDAQMDAAFREAATF
jgi:hypothetical protein